MVPFDIAEHIPEADVAPRMARSNADRLAVFGDGLVRQPLALEGAAKVGAGRRTGRAEGDARLAVAERLLPRGTTQPAKGDPQLEVDPEVAGVPPLHFAEKGHLFGNVGL